MNVMKKGEKIFGAVMLTLMAVLTLSTIIFAKGKTAGSYTLTIHKIADAKSELPAGKTLEGVECKFRVEGVLEKKGDHAGTPFTKEVSITLDKKGEGSAVINLGSPGAVSVIELNPNTAETLTTEHKIALTDISNESSTHVNSSNPKTEIDLSKQNSRISITPVAPNAKYPVKRAYKITGGGEERTIEIKDGESGGLDSLSPGHYTIEAQKAPAGFGLEVQNPRIESKAGESKTVTIDSNSGEGVLSIADDGNTHYFNVKGPSGYSDEFILPYYDEHGNKKLSYHVQHVVEGNYTMYEESYEGNAAFTVKAPKTTYTIKDDKKTYTYDYTFKQGYYSRYETPSSSNSNDYIRLRIYNIQGPANGSTIKSRVKGTLLNPPANGKDYTDLTTKNFKSTSAYLLGSNSYTKPGEDVLFKFFDNAGVTACKLDIRLYKPRIMIYTSAAGDDKKVTVDDRRYIEIQKPEDSFASKGVFYTFTILDEDGEVVTVTDSNGNSMNSLKLSSKELVRVTVPKAGTYTVHQEMKQSPQVPFTVSTTCLQSTTIQNATLSATILGEDSTIQMSKPACEAGTDDLGREYHFEVTGPSLGEEGVVVAIKAGESFKLRELLAQAGETVPEHYESGKYSVTAVDGGYAGFDLTYSDSCTLDIVSNKASVTIKNTYQKAKGAYRVVHEYYDGDVSTPDSGNFDGRSEISLFGDKDLGSTHTGDTVTKEYFYNKDGTNYEYEYVDTVYGNYGEFTETHLSDAGSVPAQDISDPPDAAPDAPDNADSPADTDESVSENGPVDTDEPISGNEPKDPPQMPESETTQADNITAIAEVPVKEQDPSAESMGGTEQAHADKVFHDTGTYAKDDSMTCAEAKTNGDNIIILRYRRVKKPAADTGSYHVVHRYYHRTSAGDIFEGSYEEDVITAPLDFSKSYTGDTVQKRTKHTPDAPDGVPHTYTYEFTVYGFYKPADEPAATEDGYRPIDGKDCAYATETGEEAIVLRYYRDEAAYNIIHEYYLRSPTGMEPVPAALALSESSDEAAGEEDEDEDSGGSGSDEGNIDEGAMAYDYMFEGESEITMHTGILGDTYTGLRVEQLPQHDNYQYTHFRYDYGILNRDGSYTEDPNMDSATATMKSEQLIILRYYREIGGAGDTPEPDVPETPGTPGTPDTPENPGTPGAPEITPQPVAAATPASPGSPGRQRAGAPQTSDNGQLEPWLFLHAASAVCLCLILSNAKCKKRRGVTIRDKHNTRFF